MKTIDARALRDPESLPGSLRRISLQAKLDPETSDIIAHAADELEHLLGVKKSLQSAVDELQESSP